MTYGLYLKSSSPPIVRNKDYDLQAYKLVLYLC